MRRACLISLAAGVVMTPTALAQWVNYQNETSTRLVASPSLVVNDNLEKDFAWADVDKDGDIDLVVMRKFPGSIQGGFRNILLMNEDGVLVDRTEEYATASDVPGDQGFLAPTNDRDAHFADVDNDGWLDLITSTTMSDQVNDILGQPRVYMNLGVDENGNWLGFRFENDRIPVLFSASGNPANPRFCDLAVADLTGDGYVDLFYVDYDTPETNGTVCIDLNGNGSTGDPGECQQSPPETPSKDYNNKFLINQGAANPGFFVDTTNTRFTSPQLAAAFGNAVFIQDMNGDGLLDVVRLNTLTTGQNVAILYANNAEGTSFTGPMSIATGAPYNMEEADLNNDGRWDLIISDDSKDKFLINTGNNPQGFATFSTHIIPDSLNEFGNTIQVADLDNDGNVDVLIADVDADLPPFCPNSGRRMHIYRNLYQEGVAISGGMLDEIGQIIPNSSLTSSYDVAPIDINNDGWVDLVIGRCAGIQVWMNQPPIALVFGYPQGLPEALVPDQPTTISIETSIIGGGEIEPGSAQVFWSIDGAAFQSAPLADLGGGAYSAELPPVPCGSTIAYYFSGDLTNGPVFTDPEGAPTEGVFLATAIDRVEVVVEDDIEGNVSGWNVVSSGTLTAGAWEPAVPNGTVVSGAQAAPSSDASPDGSIAWVTQNGAPGGLAGSSDVDGGPTTLYSPLFDLDGQDGIVSYARWFFCDDAGASGADALVVEISNDGGDTWVALETVNTNAGQWVTASFVVSDHVEPTGTMQVRWTVDDTPNNSTTEAGVDDFSVEILVCDGDACTGDLDGSGTVDGADLGALLSQWGGPGSADLDGSGTVDGADLGALLAAWGGC